MASLSDDMDFDITPNSAAIEEALIQSKVAAREASKAKRASYKARRKARMQNGRNKKSEQNLSEAMSDVVMSSTSGIQKKHNPQATKRGGGRFYRAAAPNFNRRVEMQDMTIEGAMTVAGDGDGAEGEHNTAEYTPAEHQSRKGRAAARREARTLKMSIRKSSVGVEKELVLTIEDANVILAAKSTPEAEAIALARGLAISPRPDKALITQEEAAALATREANRLRGSINNLLARQLSRVDLSSTPKAKKSSTVGITKKQRKATKREKKAMAAEGKKKTKSDKRVDKREQALLDAAEALIAKVDTDREQYEKEKLLHQARPLRTRGIEGEKLDEEVAALKAEQAEYSLRIDKLREKGREEARQAYEKAAIEEGKVTEVDKLAKMLDLVGMGRKHGN